MILLPLFVSANFIALHGTDGQQFFINPKQITTMREPVGRDLRHFPEGTRCVIVMSSGKFVAVQETCSAARKLIDPRAPD